MQELLKDATLFKMAASVRVSLYVPYAYGGYPYCVVHANDHVWCLYGKVLRQAVSPVKPPVSYARGCLGTIQQSASKTSSDQAGERFGGSPT